jgi:hypothetical protein
MKYRFANFEFDDELQQLKMPNGESRHLRLQLSKLLTALVNHSEDVHPKEALIEEIWHNASATAHDLQNLKLELEKLLGKRGLIKTISGIGYAVTVPVTPLYPLPGSDNGVGGKVLPIFPGIGTPAGSLFVHSAVSFGKNDLVKHIKRKVKWESRVRQMVLTSDDSPETMVIPFRHALTKGSEDQSWWVAVLATKVDIVSGDWDGADITPYGKFVFEARSIPSTFSAKKRTMPLLVRLEDNARDSDGGSSRQSTSWHPQEVLIPEAFVTVELALDSFNWSKDAWHWNTKPVDRANVAQIIFGHDSKIHSAQGTIEIRNVRFEV